jgi:hypothetical protein
VLVCFPADGTTICSTYDDISGTAFHPEAPDNTAVLDPQVGWEQQKFLIAWTMLYLPENELQRWLDLLEVWELGRDADPGFAERIELHDPNGRVYVARTFGKEQIFGHEVQRGVAARVLEYGNELVAKAFVTTPGPDLDADGEPEWHLAVVNGDTGRPFVKWDPTIRFLDADGRLQNGIPGCNEQENHACTCSANRACVELERYVSVPRYLREALDAYGLGHPSERGIHD